MSLFNIRQLEDRARDVDPDLRYMALEDFQKYLSNPKSQIRNISFFIPLLFKLLSDPATEVQNQAVKTFPPLVRHISDHEVVSVVTQLYDDVERISNASKFSTTVPTLALRGVFSESHSRFGNELSREVFDVLLVRLFSKDTPMSIDKIEILIEVIKSLGAALSLDEILHVVTSLITGAFKETGIIGKRSIIAVDTCLGYASHASRESENRQTSFYDAVIREIASVYSSFGESSHSSEVAFTLYQVVLARVGHSKLISADSITIVFQEIIGGLRLDNLDEPVDSDDWDIDVLVKTNVRRENSLITLTSLVPCFTTDRFIHEYATSVFDILQKCLTYDPLSYQDSDSENESHDGSDFDFSDDEDIEQFEDIGENDALAAKLRSSALIALKRILTCIPNTVSLVLAENLTSKVINSISDHSDLVSNEAMATAVVLLRQCRATTSTARSRANSDVTMCTEKGDTDPYSVMAKNYIAQFEDTIFNKLLTARKIARFGSSRVLIETLVSGFSESLSPNFLSTLSESFKEYNLNLQNYPEIIKLYKVLLQSYNSVDISGALLDAIVQDVGETLNNIAPFHSLMADILVVCKLLYEKVHGISKYASIINSLFFPAIASNLKRRDFSSDVRQHLLDSLAELIINFDLSTQNIVIAAGIFEECLGFEITVNYTLDKMFRVCEESRDIFSSTDFCSFTVDKLLMFLSSSDTALYASALILLISIFKRTSYKGDFEEMRKLTAVIFGLMKDSNDLILINQCFTILGFALRKIPADENFVRQLFLEVMNTKFVQSEDTSMKPLEFLTTQITKFNTLGKERLFSTAKSTLLPKNFISAKIIALIATQSELIDDVRVVEEDLHSYISTSNSELSTEKIIFDIHFLGCISSELELEKFTFSEFYEIPRLGANEQVNLAAARAMGMCVARDLNTYLPVLLEKYESSSRQNDPNRILYLVAIKQVMREELFEADIGKRIWDDIFRVLKAKEGALVHKEVPELKLAGNILGKIIEFDKEQDYQFILWNIICDLRAKDCNQYLIYTIVVIMKQMVSEATQEFDVRLVEQVMPYLELPNLELKLAVISTLLTGIYNKSMTSTGIIDQVILPAVFAELSAKDEFKKVIPMGPYKYVVDEGLEVRKLGYELIGAIINVDSDKIDGSHTQIDEIRIFEQLSTKGLNDSENEIVDLAVFNLMQLIEKDENVLNKTHNQQELIASLHKLSNKKLRSKASTQESESYEDTLRSVIKFSKLINQIFIKSNGLSSEWSNYYHELQNKHHLLFSAIGGH